TLHQPRADIAVTNIPSAGSRRFAMTDVKPIPDGFPRVSPSLAIDGASAAIDFYTKVLGATEQVRIPAPGGTVAFARLQIGDSLINVSEESPERGYPGPKTIGGTPGTLNIYVQNTDATRDHALPPRAHAVARGAKPRKPVENQFYGDRIGWFEAPWGHRWGVTTHVEDVSSEELAKRRAALGG